MPVFLVAILCALGFIGVAVGCYLCYVLGRLDQRVASLAIVGKATHALVNYASGELMREKMVLLREKADKSGSDHDIAAAIRAEADYADHQRRQAAMDAQPGTDAEKSGQASA